MFYKIGALRNFTKFIGKHLYQSLVFNKVAGFSFVKKEILAQVFSCKPCEISRNTFFTEHLCTTASVTGIKRNPCTAIFLVALLKLSIILLSVILRYDCIFHSYCYKYCIIYWFKVVDANILKTSCKNSTLDCSELNIINWP